MRLRKEVFKEIFKEVFKAKLLKKKETFLAPVLNVGKYQRRMQNPVGHQKWSFLPK